MRVEYSLDSDQTVIGHIMPDFINGSFVGESIRHHALSLFDALEIMHKKKTGLGLTPVESKAFMERCIKEAGKSFYDSVINNPCPDGIKKILLDNPKKKEQERLLTGLSIKIQHMASVFHTAENIGYTISQIRFEGIPKQYEIAELPKFAYLDDEDNVVNIGGDTLTKGQIKTMIVQAHVLIARIAKKDRHWHCFLQTFKGLKGEEHGEQGSQPHIHYLSDKFCNLSFEDLIAMLKTGNYPNAKIHIPIIEHV